MMNEFLEKTERLRRTGDDGMEIFGMLERKATRQATKALCRDWKDFYRIKFNLHDKALLAAQGWLQ